MGAAITITRPTFTDVDTLDAAAANAVWIVSATVPSATGASEGVIQLAGDLAGTATSPAIAAKAVTFAKFQDIATDYLLGRATAGTGSPELIPCVANARDILANATPAGAALAKAADLAAQQTLLGVVSMVTAKTTAQFDVTTSTTLADVPGLSVAVEAGNTYAFEINISLTLDATGLGKIAVAGTSTASAFKAASLYSSGTSAALTFLGSAPAAKGSSFAIGGGSGANNAIWIKGTVTISASGTLTTQFAQNAASGTSSVLVGATMLVWKI